MAIGKALVRTPLLLGLLMAVFCAGTFADAANPADNTPVTSSTPAFVGSGPAAIPAIEQKGPARDMSESQALLQQMVAASGAQQVSGDYKVALILAPPRGWYEPRGAQLVWRPPARGENQHIEAVVLDALTSKPIPSTATMDVIDRQGKVVQTQRLKYLWHPQADHYGANFVIPAAGVYNIRVQAPPPPILRHSKELGNRFTQPLNVTFTGIQITPMAPLPAEAAPGQPSGMGGSGVVPSNPVTCPPGQ